LLGRDLQTAETVPAPMTGFPDFIRKLPEAETSLRGVTLWLLQGRGGSATLFEAREDSSVPEHSHGAQWGIVVEGEMRLTIDKAARTCRRGDEYFVPAGVPHSASFKAGFRAIDFFDDPNRYRPRT
jgi:quercetin dioxygenase-like cupin family protein